MRKIVEKQAIPDDLTKDQQEALNGYFNNPQRLFYGTSIENATETFRSINAQRKNGEQEKADKRETAWFEILHYEQKKQGGNS